MEISTHGLTELLQKNTFQDCDNRGRKLQRNCCFNLWDVDTEIHTVSHKTRVCCVCIFGYLCLNKKHYKMHVFAEEFNPRPVLPCTDVLLPQRKTWWWGWLNKLWAASTSQVIICRPVRRFMLYRSFTARRSTCHGESQRARGRVTLSHFYLVALCKKSFHLHTYV